MITVMSGRRARQPDVAPDDLEASHQAHGQQHAGRRRRGRGGRPDRLGSGRFFAIEPSVSLLCVADEDSDPSLPLSVAVSGQLSRPAPS